MITHPRAALRGSSLRAALRDDVPPADVHRHAATLESVARARAQQRAERLEAGVDLDTGKISTIERTIEDAQRAHLQLPSEPAPPLKIICAWCVPSHVIRDGRDPAAHGMCPRAVARANAQMDAGATT